MPLLVILNLFVVLINLSSCTLDGSSEPLQYNTAPRHFLLCSAIGSASQLIPLLEYGKQLQDRKHNVSVLSLKDYTPLVRKYGLRSLPLEVRVDTQELNRLKDLDKHMAAEYGYEAFLEGQERKELEQANAKVFREMKGKVGEMLREGHGPNVVVAESLSDPCIAVADVYQLPLVLTGHSLGRKGEWNVALDKKRRESECDLKGNTSPLT
jgi:hypothetical protein